MCKKIEDAYFELEPVIDIATDQFIINLNEDSSDSKSSYSESDSYEVNSSDDEMDCDMFFFLFVDIN